MTVYRNKNFYIILREKEIVFVNKVIGPCSYPAWLGKNRSVMREAQKAIRANPPECIVDFLHIVGKYELQGLHDTSEPVDESLFA